MSDAVLLYMQLITAMRGSDDSAALKLFAPDFVAYEDPGMPYGGRYEGGEGFLRLRRKVYDIWGSGALNLLFVCGDPDGAHASAHFKLVGRPQGAAEPIEGDVTVVWTFRDDLAVEARVFYFDTPRLSAALGESRLR
jgi:ketosteroid isomerase-like protein